MKRLSFGFALALLVFAGVAVAHMPQNYESVHFDSSSPDLGWLPRRGALRFGDGWNHLPYEEYPGFAERESGELHTPRWDEEDARVANHQQWLKQAFATANNARWKKARHTVRYISKRFGWTGELRDFDTVLGRMLGLPEKQQAALTPAMKLYLNGLNIAAANKTGSKAFETLAEMPNAGFLREHATYQQASLAWLYPDARKQYRQFLTDFPKSPKCEDALIMLARSAILPELRKDRDIMEGKRAMAQLKREFPRSRFLKELPGLRARLLYLDKQYLPAANAYLKIGDLNSAEIVVKQMESPDQDRFNIKLMTAYLRQVTRTPDYYVWEQALNRLRQMRTTVTLEQARQMAKLLRADPELAADYLYYRMYHALERKTDLKQLTQFAAEVVAAHPNAQFSPQVLTRLAEVSYRNRQYARAIGWTNRSLERGTTDRALYVRGASRHKLKQIAGATEDFERLMRQFPRSPLKRSAHENLCLLYEATGRFDKALDGYFTLSPFHVQEDEIEEFNGSGFDCDIAYLLDVRMTTAQIADYIRYHPRHAERDLLHYSLGIRYLREEQWDEAERELRRLPKSVYAQFSEGRKEWAEKPSPEPLVAVRELRNLYRQITLARTGNARAQAMYNYASYYSTHGTLLLYNPALWDNERQLAFDYWWNERTATKQDTLAIRRYMYEHEAFARSRAICKQVARQYPHAPILPYVLFRQAAATRRLAHFNSWWSQETQRVKLWQDSIGTMRRIARTYPKHPVAAKARKYADVFDKEMRGWIW
jgi:outer membrane protein assembly factor BamD (BamD/ComL family)